MAETIAVYGATGHTGGLVARELAARGLDVVLAGRDEARLRERAGSINGRVEVHRVATDDTRGLRGLAEEVDAVVNCAGPFSLTGEAVVEAAIAGGAHYVDHAAEPLYHRRVFERFAIPARAAAVAVVPGMSFYCSVADTVAHRLAAQLEGVDRLTVAYAVDDWLMTPASQAAARQIAAEGRLTFVDGRLEHVTGEMPQRTFDFPPPLGARAVFAQYAGGEVLTIPRHTPASTVEVLMTASTFASPAVFGGDEVPDVERARSRFTVAVRADRAEEPAGAWVRGHDVYGSGAWLAAEAAARLVARPPELTGVLAPAEAVDAHDLLAAFARTPFVAEAT